MMNVGTVRRSIEIPMISNVLIVCSFSKNSTQHEIFIGLSFLKKLFNKIFQKYFVSILKDFTKIF